MVHLVDSMAFLGQTPWHGLGNQLTAKQPIEVWAELAAIKCTVEQSLVHFMADHHNTFNQTELTYKDWENHSIGVCWLSGSFNEQNICYI
jgi:hypothetical protein